MHNGFAENMIDPYESRCTVCKHVSYIVLISRRLKYKPMCVCVCVYIRILYCQITVIVRVCVRVTTVGAAVRTSDWRRSNDINNRKYRFAPRQFSTLLSRSLSPAPHNVATDPQSPKATRYRNNDSIILSSHPPTILEK